MPGVLTIPGVRTARGVRPAGVRAPEERAAVPDLRVGLVGPGVDRSVISSACAVRARIGTTAGSDVRLKMGSKS